MDSFHAAGEVAAIRASCWKNGQLCLSTNGHIGHLSGEALLGHQRWRTSPVDALALPSNMSFLRDDVLSNARIVVSSPPKNPLLREVSNQSHLLSQQYDVPKLLFRGWAHPEYQKPTVVLMVEQRGRTKPFVWACLTQPYVDVGRH